MDSYTVVTRRSRRSSQMSKLYRSGASKGAYARKRKHRTRHSRKSRYSKGRRAGKKRFRRGRPRKRRLSYMTGLGSATAKSNKGRVKTVKTGPLRGRKYVSAEA